MYNERIISYRNIYIEGCRDVWYERTSIFNARLKGIKYIKDISLIYLILFNLA